MAGLYFEDFSVGQEFRESRSRPRAGIVEFEHHALNQNDEVVGKCRRMAMMHKRPV
nr:hypothetical protein [uncultured Bradyrhizobium sp.]